jgi:hypothetical protein
MAIAAMVRSPSVANDLIAAPRGASPVVSSPVSRHVSPSADDQTRTSQPTHDLPASRISDGIDWI